MKNVLLCIALFSFACAEAIVPNEIEKDAGTHDAKPTQDSGSVASDTNSCVEMVSLTREKPIIMVVLDRSGSMTEVLPPVSKWVAAVNAVNRIVGDTESSIYWGLHSFPADQGCGVLPPEIPPALDNADEIKDFLRLTDPTGATPTAQALALSDSELRRIPWSGQKYMLLVTDGAPNCEPPTVIEPAETIATIENAAIAGIRTFVVGLSTSSTVSMNLNLMAEAGLETNKTGPTKFYDASNADNLTEILKYMSQSVALCAIKLNQKLDNPDKVTVRMDNIVVPRDVSLADGWEVTSDGYILQFYGTWCDAMKTAKDIKLINKCGTI
jgi:hypothetical protein